MKNANGGQSRYHQLIERIFFDRYSEGIAEIPFERSALKVAAKELDIELPDNLGDVIYSIRFRTPMPTRVLETQPKELEWIIELVGRSRYRFRLAKKNRIVQTSQDTAWCSQRYPSLRCRAISAQFVSSDQIALFELKIENDELRVLEERHYRLVASGELDAADIVAYR